MRHQIANLIEALTLSCWLIFGFGVFGVILSFSTNQELWLWILPSAALVLACLFLIMPALLSFIAQFLEVLLYSVARLCISKKAAITASSRAKEALSNYCAQSACPSGSLALMVSRFATARLAVVSKIQVIAGQKAQHIQTYVSISSSA